MTARLDFSTPHVLRNEAEYDAARAEVIALLDQDPAPDSEAGERLEFLTVLIAAYDDTHARIGSVLPTPQEVVDFALAQRGEPRTSLHAVLGGKSRVSEFYSGKRPLSIAQVQALRRQFGLPADLLLPAAESEAQALRGVRERAVSRRSPAAVAERPKQQQVKRLALKGTETLSRGGSRATSPKAAGVGRGRGGTADEGSRVAKGGRKEIQSTARKASAHERATSKATRGSGR